MTLGIMPPPARLARHIPLPWRPPRPRHVSVAHYLDEHLPELWPLVGTAKFSALIRCTLGPEPQVESSELIAGPYLHER